MRAWLGLTTLLGLGLLPRLGHASPEDVFGFGARTSSMGGTGAAIAEGYEAVYENPALLSTAKERSLTLGMMGATFDLSATSPDGAEQSRVSYDNLTGSLIGATLPIPFGGFLANRIVVGLGFFTPFDLIVRGRILFPETVQFPVADRTQSVAIHAALGIDFGHGVRFGGGFAALAALSGSVIAQTDASGRIGTTVEDTLIAAYAPVLGASYDITPDYRVGATFRGELSGRFNVIILVEDLGQIVVPPLNISGTAQYDPHQVAIEFARTSGHHRLAVGVTWKHWSAFPGLVDATVRCPYDTQTFELESCAALVPPDPGYSDTFVPRVGYEGVFRGRDGADMHFRAGYFLEPTPAPEQTGDANVIDESRSAFSLGYGLQLSDPLPPFRFDWFGQVQLLHGRTHEKDAGALSRPAPDLSTSGVILAGGTTMGVSF